MKVVDTRFLIDLLMGDEGAIRKAREIDEARWAATTSINVFELIYGLFGTMYLNSEIRLPAAERLLSRLDVDGMVAVIAKVNGCESNITRNPDRYDKIPDLKTERY